MYLSGRVILGGVLLLGVTWPAAAQDPADELVLLKQEVQKLRLQIAEAKLELNKQLRLREQIQQFRKAENPDADIDRWKIQASAIGEERQRLQTQNRKLKQLGASVRDAARDPLVGAPTRKAPEPNLRPPVLDYKMGLIHLGQVTETTYVDPTTGAVLVSRYPNIDRRNVKVRGTIQNVRPEPFRYTFEIRFAGRARSGASRPPIVGRWRYQTPLLSADQLHAFEVTVPVTDVADIYVLQIGNITWDQVGPADKTPKKAAGQKNPAQAPVR